MNRDRRVFHNRRKNCRITIADYDAGYQSRIDVSKIMKVLAFFTAPRTLTNKWLNNK